MPDDLIDDLSIDGDRFSVVVNAEGVHSIWPAGQPVPDGWTRTGHIGELQSCMDYVDAHWTAMQPRRN